MPDKLTSLKKLIFSKKLPDHDFLFSLASEVSELQEKEITSYRCASVEDIPGSLLDFTAEKLPMIVVPDIHSRPDFIWNILNFTLPETVSSKKLTVLEALEKKRIRLVCVGDALHSERTRDRWAKIQLEFDAGIYTGLSMKEEMLYGLRTICSLMELKKFFPENFHFLKGNHENIYNRTGEGDYGFKKYADEGSMVRQFMFEYYGDDVIFILSCIENSMPLVVLTDNCVISHAEPYTGFTREKIVNARNYPEVIEGLTWTDNDTAEEGSVLQLIKNLSGADEKALENYIYLAGHRPVPEVYLTRQNGKFIQFHNPGSQNVAVVIPGVKFNPETDIISVLK